MKAVAAALRSVVALVEAALKPGWLARLLLLPPGRAAQFAFVDRCLVDALGRRQRRQQGGRVQVQFDFGDPPDDGGRLQHETTKMPTTRPRASCSSATLRALQAGTPTGGRAGERKQVNVRALC